MALQVSLPAQEFPLPKTKDLYLVLLVSRSKYLQLKVLALYTPGNRLPHGITFCIVKRIFLVIFHFCNMFTVRKVKIGRNLFPDVYRENTFRNMFLRGERTSAYGRKRYGEKTAASRAKFMCSRSLLYED